MREVVVEGRMDHGIRTRRSGAKAVKVFQGAAMRFGASRRKGSRSGIGPRQAKDAMPGRQKLGYDAGSDEAGRAR